MSFKCIIFILLVFCSKFECATVRIMFNRCSFGGFTCTTVNQKSLVIYECPAGVNDVSIYLHSFNSPSNIGSLTMKNCAKVTFYIRCTDVRRPIQLVKLINIKHLIFERTNFVSQVPPTFILENIDYIETIPSFTFSQFNKRLNSDRCSTPFADFGNFSMTNVKIDTVESNAFYIPNGFEHFHISNVTINRVQGSAVFAKLYNNGSFIINNSTINVLEHLGVQLVGKNVSINNNRFVDISSSGINGTIENFVFEHNYVNSLQPQAFSILSKNVLIQNNRFEYLKSGALEKISPGLLEDSGRNFGSLNFIYAFRENYVNSLDAGSLHPDTDAYNNVRSEIEVLLNQFNCHCENIAWMVSELGHGSNTALTSDFHEELLQNDTKNVCAHSCSLPLSSIKKMVTNGKCNPDITIDSLCVKNQTTTTTTTTTRKNVYVTSGVSKITTTEKPKKYRPLLAFLSGSSVPEVHIITSILLPLGLRRLM